MPSINQLKYILAIHRFGHFGQAAKSCNVSQPTLSTQVQKAEELLGLTLFNRHHKPVSVTEEGAAVVEQAQVVVAAHERMVRLVKGNFKEVAGALRLGVIPTLAPYVLPWFLSKFAKAYPLVDLSITELRTDDIIAEIECQSLDLGLVATPLLEPNLVERRLFQDPFYLYAHPDDPLLQTPRLLAEALVPEQMWLLHEGHCVRNQTISLCTSNIASQSKSIRFEAGSFETLKNLIDASDGYTIVPETYARTLTKLQRETQVRAFDALTPVREVGLVHLRSTWKADLFDALQEAIMQSLPRPFRTFNEDARCLPVR